MFDETLIAGERVTRSHQVDGDRLAFKVRVPWYRSVYLSCLNRADITVNGEPIANGGVSFRLYGTTYPFAELVKNESVLWFVLDEAEILLALPPGMADCDRYDINLALFVRIPYHRGSTFQQVSTCQRALPVAERVSL